MTNEDLALEKQHDRFVTTVDALSEETAANFLSGLCESNEVFLFLPAIMY